LLKQVMQREPSPRMVSLPQDMRKTLVEMYPALIESRIAAGSYGAMPASDIETVGLPAVLICRADMPADVVTDILQHLRTRLPQLHVAHPVLSTLSDEIMMSLDSLVYHSAIDMGLGVREK
jgi:TRAP-type uncharacterized transport system substrate-binding protein